MMFASPSSFRAHTARAASLVALSVGTLALSSGCYLASDGKNVERRLLQVEEQQQEFMTTFASTRDELRTLVAQADRQVSQLQATLEEARTVLGRSSANMGAQLDSVEQQVRNLQGQLDAQGFGNEELQRALDTLRTDMEFRLDQLER